MIFISISKNDSERIVESFVTDVSRINGSEEIANEALNILNDDFNKSILFRILLIKFKEEFRNFDNGEFDMKIQIFSALSAMFDEDCDEKQMPPRFKGIFKSDIDFAWKNKSLQFAIDQFVESFYMFDSLENKYPNLVKELK